MATRLLRSLFLACCLAGAVAPAQAQNTSMQRLLLERQQQQQEQALKQQQHAESLDAHLSPAQRQQLEMRQQDQRLRQQALNQRQTQQLLELEQSLKNTAPAQQQPALDLRLQQYRREQELLLQQFERERRDAAQDSAK